MGQHVSCLDPYRIATDALSSLSVADELFVDACGMHMEDSFLFSFRRDPDDPDYTWLVRDLLNNKTTSMTPGQVRKFLHARIDDGAMIVNSIAIWTPELQQVTTLFQTKRSITFQMP